ncbi:propanediol utilization microcompartment protein PduB [Clostridium estertheticum]|uniref:Microcompartment protein PduB n=1 Tax=Clostridium estertheticum subsp. estertheticum TaxID=1552 RepID=A0A1J0GFB9_9CLOT|nr:propanediol utilization microcompartment protein PduB [Clostridium estertheticum]APC39582.1 microcompartment protein PduB [Clostridium estertheticum subsp. estertheticum]MBU3072266.1 propanediol utilization microcompartment protein PduB [Clostridium estertheticum]MBU3162358.1 propanediol utilization microcompartment protein PduB [Clostridium estertheticum]MBZ9614386.1 propanediol utilization microcompartment protein PduB [Clostridium estertheticum subsp. laramiense]MCB2352723.1 propanediol 
MNTQLIEKVYEEVRRKIASGEIKANDIEKTVKELAKCENESKVKNEIIEVKEVKKEGKFMQAPGLTEFVGTGIGDTIGLVIANIDSALHAAMGIDKKFHSIGIIGARTGAGPQIMAADEAVKATNTEIVSIELPRDTKGGAGHGCLIIFGAEDVSDARRAVEVTLKELPRTFGDVYGNDAGHLEMQYSARASLAIEKAFGAPVGKAFGLVIGAPAAIGVMMADTAVKTANVEIVAYSSPSKGTSHSNEVILAITGDSGAVRQAVIAGREVGKKLLNALGDEPTSTTEPYI